MLGDKRSALASLQKALLLAPKDAEVMFRAAMVYNQFGDQAQTLDWLKKAVAAHYSRTIVRDTPEFGTPAIQPEFQSNYRRRLIVTPPVLGGNDRNRDSMCPRVRRPPLSVARLCRPSSPTGKENCGVEGSRRAIRKRKSSTESSTPGSAGRGELQLPARPGGGRKWRSRTVITACRSKVHAEWHLSASVIGYWMALKLAACCTTLICHAVARLERSPPGVVHRTTRRCNQVRPSQSVHLWRATANKHRLGCHHDLSATIE